MTCTTNNAYTSTLISNYTGIKSSSKYRLETENISFFQIITNLL